MSKNLRFPMIVCTKPLTILVVVALLTLAPTVGSTPAQQLDQAADTTVFPADQTASQEAVYPQSPVGVAVRDNPNDGGGAVKITWELSPDDYDGGLVEAYTVYRSESIDGPFIEVGDVTAGAREFMDGSTDDGRSYYYVLIAIADPTSDRSLALSLGNRSQVTGPVSSSAQWFDFRRVNVFFGTALLSFFIIFMIVQAKSGKELFIRKIAGMEAVDEAVGRATEMGRKIFYVPGIQDMDNVQTIAGMTILGRVAELAGEYETWLEVPVCRSMVLVTAKEVVKEAYTKVGRPDAYNENQVHYLTDDQFGYAAAIDGMVVREKPATIFYMGAFFAESLILAETGNATGAIQIAGTAMPSQLPFFVASCDYTLIGEELFAASAYLSKEPKLLGSLKGQDMGKAVILAALLLGIVLETFGIWDFSQLFSVIE